MNLLWVILSTAKFFQKPSPKIKYQQLFFQDFSVKILGNWNVALSEFELIFFLQFWKNLENILFFQFFLTHITPLNISNILNILFIFLSYACSIAIVRFIYFRGALTSAKITPFHLLIYSKMFYRELTNTCHKIYNSIIRYIKSNSKSRKFINKIPLWLLENLNLLSITKIEGIPKLNFN